MSTPNYKGAVYYGEMPCDKEEAKHDPHVWNTKHMVFGPYLCHGEPSRKVKRTSSGMPTWLTSAFDGAARRKAEREQPAEEIAKLKARVTELEAENASLFRRLSNQEKYNVDSRRSLGEHIDRLTAENKELKAGD